MNQRRLFRARSAPVAALLAFAAAAPAAHAATLFTQGPTSGASAFISRTTPGGPFGFTNRRLADNFQLGTTSTIESLTWWGGDETADADPDLANLAGFSIRLFDASGTSGAPGALLAERTLTSADFTTTSVPGTVGLLGAPMYRFSTTFAAPLFQAQAGATYWLSIAAVLNTNPDFTNEAWQWAGSSGLSDTLIAQDRFDGQGYLLRTLAIRNAAFELSGTPIPAPGATALLAASGVLIARRRR